MDLMLESIEDINESHLSLLGGFFVFIA